MAILSAEVIIHWDKIHRVSQVYIAGKLMPLILGHGQLLDVRYCLILENDGVDNEEDEKTQVHDLYIFINIQWLMGLKIHVLDINHSLYQSKEFNRHYKF